MPYSEQYIKEKLVNELNATHVQKKFDLTNKMKELEEKLKEMEKIGILIGVAVILRCSIGFHSYSGEGKPPMYGDYEAQRHWQEITFNLPIEQWYKNSSDNDLEYWGLDYPPLTAYHSLIVGKIANSMNKSFIELKKSRGLESDDHKNFMRNSVLFADLFIYFPAIIYYFYSSNIIEKNSKIINNIFDFKQIHFYIISGLIYPGIMLIDHGHFQYNCISLGFFIFGVSKILNNSFIFGSFFFVLAVNYKQMELYHALPFFFYILGICNAKFKKSLLSSLKLFLSVSLTVLITFFIIWYPFIKKSAFFDVLVRLFPVNRGVFEDKVSNIWCFLNIFIKLKELFNNYELAKICLFTTIISILPSNIDIFLKPTKEKFLLCLINTALGFYLFSFQVHEKTILLVSIPIILYFHKDPFFCYWFLIISTFSMIPLLIKDNLLMAFGATMVFHHFSLDLMFPDLFDISKYLHRKMNNNYFPIILKFLFYFSIFGCFLLIIASVIIEPPIKYPDLFPLIISVYSCIHFCAFFIYFNVKQILLKKKKIKLK